MSEAYHALTVTSNRSPLSTQASTTLACSFLVILVFFSRAFTFAHNTPALFFLCFRSSFGPHHTPNILVSPDSSLPNSSFSSLLSLFVSSKVSITAFIAVTPSSSSSVSPMGVVSSANREREKTTVEASLLYLSTLSGFGNLLHGIQRHLTPTLLFFSLYA